MIYPRDFVFEARFLIGRHSCFPVIFQNLNLLVRDDCTKDFSDIVFANCLWIVGEWFILYLQYYCRYEDLGP